MAEIEFELHDLPAHTMIVMDSSREAEVRARQLVVACCERNSVPVLMLLPDPKVAGLFRLDGQTVAAPPAAPSDPGDLALVRPGPLQLHLMIGTGAGFVHAHAGLGRVVETPGLSPWPVLGWWRE